MTAIDDDFETTGIHNFAVLKAEILRRSRAAEWEVARKEWRFIQLYEHCFKACLCEHAPIKYICVIENRLTKAVVEVGNVCIKRFLGIRADLIFAALKRIKADVAKPLNPDAIVFFFGIGTLSQFEYEFSQDTWRKRQLTGKQHDKRVQINRKILRWVALWAQQPEPPAMRSPAA